MDELPFDYLVQFVYHTHMARVEVFQTTYEPDGTSSTSDLYASSPKDVDGAVRKFGVFTPGVGIFETMIIPSTGPEQKADIFQADNSTRKGGVGVEEVHGAPYVHVGEITSESPSFSLFSTAIDGKEVSFSVQLVAADTLIDFPSRDLLSNTDLITAAD